jgi:hypothetical protein
VQEDRRRQWTEEACARGLFALGIDAPEIGQVRAQARLGSMSVEIGTLTQSAWTGATKGNSFVHGCFQEHGEK